MLNVLLLKKQILRKKIIIFLSVFLISTELPQSASALEEPIKNAFDFTFIKADGTILPLARYKGRTILIVNTSPNCSFGGQYDGLQQLFQHYRSRGLVVIALSSKDFTDDLTWKEEFDPRCSPAFNIKFPVAEVDNATGINAHPFYKWIEAQLGTEALPKDNLYKYLISPEGHVIEWFMPTVLPSSARLIDTIEISLPPIYTVSNNL